MSLGKHPVQIRKIGYTVETIIVLVVIAVLIAVIYNRYQQIQYEANRTLRRQEINTLSMAVKLYKIRNGYYPKSLTDVVEQKTLDNDTIKILGLDERVVSQTLLDPFGKPYKYDNKTGMIQ